MRFLLFLLFVFVFGVAPNLRAQEAITLGGSNPVGRPAMGSIFPRETYGIFGKRSISGPLIRDNPNSRFGNNGAVYDERGRWIGVAADPPSSRFQRYWEHPEFNSPVNSEIPVSPTSPMNADAFYELYTKGNRPVSTPQSSNPPEPIEQSVNRLAEMTLSGELVQNPSPGPSPEEISPGPAPQQPMPQAQISTFRGERSPWSRAASRAPGVFSDRVGAGGNPTVRTAQPGPPAAASNTLSGSTRGVGSGMLNPTRAAQGVESLRASRTPPPIYAPLDPQIRAAQERQERIKALQQLETALTEMLLSARDITILSPIQVKYQNGTVLLRGLVANEADRVRAGEILLTSPYVKQVNNQMSVFEKE